MLFREHFHDTHFRMTLRFVAGLTELKDDSYQEYFSKEVDLQCIRNHCLVLNLISTLCFIRIHNCLVKTFVIQSIVNILFMNPIMIQILYNYFILLTSLKTKYCVKDLFHPLKTPLSV